MHDNFCFEFHSFLPASVAKTYNDALSACTVQLFGRTFNGESVCLNLIGACPYFYIQMGHDSFELSSCIFGGEDRLNSAGLNSSQFSLSKVRKVAFYQFQKGTTNFVKVECCNEGVRKRFLDFIKINADLGLKIFEVILFSKFNFSILKIFEGSYFLCPPIHVRFRYCWDGKCHSGQCFTSSTRSCNFIL